MAETVTRLSALSLIIAIGFGVVAGSLLTASVMTRYYVTGKAGNIILVDRFTGQLQSCDYSKCDPIEQSTKPTWYGDFVKHSAASN